MTEAELKKMTVKQLRELAVEKTDLAGITSMKKDELVNAIMEKLGIEKAAKKVTVDTIKDKRAAKKEILRLKQKKFGLFKSEIKNPKQLRNIRRRVRNLKRHIRKVM